MRRKGSLLREALVLPPGALLAPTAAPSSLLSTDASVAPVASCSDVIVADKMFVALVTVNDALIVNHSDAALRMCRSHSLDTSPRMRALASRSYYFQTTTIAPVHKGYLLLEPKDADDASLVRMYSSTSLAGPSTTVRHHPHVNYPCLLGLPMSDLLLAFTRKGEAYHSESEGAKALLNSLCCSSPQNNLRSSLLKRRWPGESHLSTGVPIPKSHTLLSDDNTEQRTTPDLVIFPFCLAMASSSVTQLLNCPKQVYDVDEEQTLHEPSTGVIDGSEALLVPIQCPSVSNREEEGPDTLDWPQSFLLYSRDPMVTFTVSLGEVVRMKDSLTVLIGHAYAPKRAERTPKQGAPPSSSHVAPPVRREEKVSKLLNLFVTAAEGPSAVSDHPKVSPSVGQGLLSPDISGKLLLGGTGGIGSRAILSTTMEGLQESAESNALTRSLQKEIAREKREREECAKLSARRDAERRSALHRYISERERLGERIDWNVVRDEFGIVMESGDM